MALAPEGLGLVGTGIEPAAGLLLDRGTVPEIVRFRRSVKIGEKPDSNVRRVARIRQILRHLARELPVKDGFLERHVDGAEGAPVTFLGLELEGFEL